MKINVDIICIVLKIPILWDAKNDFFCEVLVINAKYSESKNWHTSHIFFIVSGIFAISQYHISTNKRLLKKLLNTLFGKGINEFKCTFL